MYSTLCVTRSASLLQPVFLPVHHLAGHPSSLICASRIELWGVISVGVSASPCLCLSCCLSYQLFITFPPEKQHLSLAKTLPHQVFVSFHYCVVVVPVLKRIPVTLSPSQTRPQWTFPQKTASLPMSESQTRSSLYWWWLWNLKQKNITLSLSTMYGVSGSQSQ